MWISGYVEVCIGFPFWLFKRVYRRPVAPPLTAPLPRRLPGTPSPFLRDGRRHLDVPYLLPKDTTELERLDYQHHALTALLGGLTLVPLPMKLSSVLDVGCGTGRWAYEMARAFPHCQVVGLDLEPAPSRGQQVSPNYLFVQGNVLTGLRQHGYPHPQRFEVCHSVVSHLLTLAQYSRRTGTGVLLVTDSPQMQQEALFEIQQGPCAGILAGRGLAACHRAP